MLHTIFGILFFTPLVIGVVYGTIIAIKSMIKDPVFRNTFLVILGIFVWIGMWIGYLYTDPLVQHVK